MYLCERPLMVPFEALEPCEEHHTYHMEGSVTNRAFSNRFQFNNERKVTDLQKELRKTVKASITETNIIYITNLLAYFLSHDEHFAREYKHYRD